jgi:hypothetical protein
MKRLLLSSAAGALALCAFSYGAQATTVLTENFNDAAFNSGTTVGAGDPVGAQTDRVGWDAAHFTNIVDHNGWTFTGSTFYVTDNTDTNGAVYVNEPNAVALHVQSLPDAAVYSVTFTYWGDNRPPSYTSQTNPVTDSLYELFVYVNGVQVGHISDADGEINSTTGTTVVLTGLHTDGSGNFDLSFSQATGHEASPIIDDVIISTTPLPAALPMFGAGLGLLGFLARRRKWKNAPAIAG